MKISTRFFLYISTLLILSSVGLGIISVRDERSHLMNEIRGQARTLAKILATTFKYYHIGNSHQRIGELIHAVMPHGQEGNNLLINIYDQQGQLMDFSFAHGVNERIPHQTEIPIEIAAGTREQLIKDGSQEYFSVVSPILSSTEDLQGVVEVLISLEPINKNLAGLIRKFIAIILLTASLLGILIYLVTRWSILLPIARLKEASKKIGRAHV